MKERPILFSGPMIRALLGGTKTVTRRVIKNPTLRSHDGCRFDRWQGGYADGRCRAVFDVDDEANAIGIPSPYGQPGDRLWVREAWRHADWTDDGTPYLGYRADGAVRLIEDVPDGWGDRLAERWADLSAAKNYEIDNRAADRAWRPSIHMPRWASRLDLELTAVRVERVAEITPEDAVAEGLTQRGCWWGPGPDWQGDGDGTSPVEAYRSLWDSLNAHRGHGWDLNPWTWVLEFRRVAP